MRRCVRDEEGINLLYGKGWSATLMPIPPATASITNEHLVKDINGNSPSHAQGAKDPNPSTISPRSPRADPFRTVCTSTDISPSSPSQSDVYVGLTIPHPAPAQGQSPRGVIESIRKRPSKLSFLDAVLADTGALDGARVFPIYTTRKTSGGVGRAVLLGDASHGMVPFCGAGASAAVVDAVDLVGVVLRCRGESGGRVVL